MILCTHLGLTPDFEQSAAYVESWLKALKAADLLVQLAGPDEKEVAA